MLETVALCTLIFDLQGLRLSFLPSNLQTEIHSEMGFDPWNEDTLETMAIALGAASEGDAKKAVMALLTAESLIREMSPMETQDAINSCSRRYGSLINSK